jgi:hypothetical protein
MYVNGKIITIESIPGMAGGEVKENDGGGEFSMIYLTYCKKL